MITADAPLMSDGLAALPTAELIALGQRLMARHRVEPIRLPRDGVMLLTMEDAVHHDPFHLGELPVAEAAVEVIAEDGRRARGGACVLLGGREAAIAAAVCEAVVAGGFDGADEVHAAAAKGRTLRREQAQGRAAIRAATRVRFDDLAEGR